MWLWLKQEQTSNNSPAAVDTVLAMCHTRALALEHSPRHHLSDQLVSMGGGVVVPVGVWLVLSGVVAVPVSLWLVLWLVHQRLEASV